MRKVVVGAVVLAALVVPAASASAGGGPIKDVRIVNLNLLHGIACPEETEGCQATDRMALLARQIEAAGCPEIVGLQEVNANIAKLLDQERTGICDDSYEVVFSKKPRSNDVERVLTTLDVKSEKILPLAGNFRTASRAVLESDIGTIVVTVTHQDGDDSVRTPSTVCRENDPRCPPKTCPPGTEISTCQTIQSLKLAGAGGGGGVRVLMGDFNVTPTSARYASIIEAGWSDTHLLAGNAECDPASAEGCTAGRVDNQVESLKDPTKRQVERIDFLFVKPSKGCAVKVDNAADGDGDSVGTGIWNGEPTLDGPNGIVWVADHTGVSADLSCGVEEGDDG